ncbi:MAG TPA: Nif3-like dinuclear metal center hexameric protein [Planctomycetaceae bacterium]|nr:Nif3-like dinuclear metal center hexameric protein [Planctomycetaceae bacterium]
MVRACRVADVVAHLEALAPLELAEDWDNVGLLIGRNHASVERILTCLTLTPEVAAEAVQQRAQLIVTHHPVLFRPVQRLTADTPEGAMLLELIAAGIAVYSPHTGYDSSRDGINQQLAELFELREIAVLRSPTRQSARGVPDTPDTAAAGDPSCAAGANRPAGAGRCGHLPRAMTLDELISLVKDRLKVAHLQFVGDERMTVNRMAIACGAAAEFLSDALEQNCQVFLTGEARFHACVEARTRGLGLLLPGHYATERPAMERLAEMLTARFPDLSVWPSRAETDPLRWA